MPGVMPFSALSFFVSSATSARTFAAIAFPSMIWAAMAARTLCQTVGGASGKSDHRVRKIVGSHHWRNGRSGGRPLDRHNAVRAGRRVHREPPRPAARAAGRARSNAPPAPSSADLHAQARAHFARHVCALFADVARADGDVVRDEVRVVRAFFQQDLRFSPEELELVRVSLKDALANPSDLGRRSTSAGRSWSVGAVAAARCALRAGVSGRRPPPAGGRGDQAHLLCAGDPRLGPTGNPGHSPRHPRERLDVLGVPPEIPDDESGARTGGSPPSTIPTGSPTWGKARSRSRLAGSARSTKPGSRSASSGGFEVAPRLPPGVVAITIHGSRARRPAHPCRRRRGAPHPLVHRAPAGLQAPGEELLRVRRAHHRAPGQGDEPRGLPEDHAHLDGEDSELARWRSSAPSTR